MRGDVVSSRRVISLEEVQAEPYEDAFLVEDLITTRITICSGEPKAGKSLLAAGVVMALLNGEEAFLGQRILRNVERVMFLLTDDGADSELKARLEGHVPAGAVVLHQIDPTQTADDDYWRTIRDDVSREGVDFVVLDNVIGALPLGEDISLGTTAQGFMRRARMLSEAAPVLLISHTAKGGDEGFSTASSPMGGRAFAAQSRGVIVLRRSERHGLSLRTSINRARKDLNLSLEVEPVAEGSEVPSWSLRGAESTEVRKARRSKETLDAWAERAAQVLEEQPEGVTSWSALGQHYSTLWGMASGSIRQDRKLRALIDYDETRGQWVSTEVADSLAA